MSTKYKLKTSRDNWKGKAINNGKELRYHKKEKNRIKKDRDRYKKEVRELKKELDKFKELQKNKQSVSSKEDTIYIVLQLFLEAHIGFRAVHRVLKVLGGYLELIQTPCVQTIINWVNRYSIAKIKNLTLSASFEFDSKALSNGFIFIIDTSIGLGSGKILPVLALDMNHHVRNEGAPNLKNVCCVAISVSASWTGEAIADFLQKVIAVIGRPVAYLKDGGKDLAKAENILGERGFYSLSIDDISHVVANLLKHEYQNHPMFEIFTSACGKVSKKLKQTILACLAPPKVTTKARFMNLHRLVKWADQLLKHSPKGRASKNSMLEKLRASLDQIPETKIFIKRFLRDSIPLLECQKVLKNKGLCHDTYSECQQLIETIPERSAVRKGFTDWADKQLLVAEKLGLEKIGMPISSDTIESLFGVSKEHGVGKIKDANRIAVRIPSICGELTKEDVQKVLSISVKEQQQVLDLLPSLTKQRRQILPNPGSIEKIKTDGSKQYLELIPVAQKRSNKSKNTNISIDCNNTAGPGMISKKHTEIPPEARIS